MEYLAGCEENQFNLCIADPPYGIGEHGGKIRTNKNRPCYELRKETPKYENKYWDNETPSSEYWNEFFRVSKNQIVFGANYFTEYLTPSMGWIFWDKKFENTVFSDGEFIYTSIHRGAKKFVKSSKAETKGGVERIHPTQKPIALYRWLLQNYAKPGDTILDTHGGSMSIAIACYIEGFDLVCIEKDKDYYDAAKKRFATYVANNPQMFSHEELRTESKQVDMFEKV